MKKFYGQQVYVQSAGVKNDMEIDGFSISVCQEIGVELARHRSRSFEEMQQWGDDLGSRTEAIVIGPAIGEVTKGKKEIKKLWKKRVEAETRAAVSGEITAEVTADGQLAWVTAPITRVEKDEPPLPLRVFAVFEKNGDGWKMIALHESLAIDEPGAGAKFAKIVPPPLTAEPPPEVEAPKVDKKDPKKKKKKKKKKQADDDDA